MPGTLVPYQADRLVLLPVSRQEQPSQGVIVMAV